MKRISVEINQDEVEVAHAICDLPWWQHICAMWWWSTVGIGDS